MLEFWQSLIISAALLTLVIIVLGFIIIPCCKRNGNQNTTEEHTATWGRMATPYHNNESYSFSITSMPPYFFMNELSYDSYSASL